MNPKLSPVWLPICTFTSSTWNPIYKIKSFWNSNSIYDETPLPVYDRDFCGFHEWLQDQSIIPHLSLINLYVLLLSLSCWVNLSIEFLLLIPWCIYMNIFNSWRSIWVYLKFAFFYFSLSIYINFIIKGHLLAVLYALIDSVFALNWFLIPNNVLHFLLFVCFVFNMIPCK